MDRARVVFSHKRNITVADPYISFGGPRGAEGGKGVEKDVPLATRVGVWTGLFDFFNYSIFIFFQSFI